MNTMRQLCARLVIGFNNIQLCKAVAIREPDIMLLHKHRWFSDSSIERSLQKSSGEININPQISIRNNDEQKLSPLIFIFGWGNGLKKNLLKYSEIFEQRNFTSVVITTTLLNSLIRTSTAGKKEGENAKNVFLELTDNNRKVMLCSFSNGGCAVSHLMLESLLSNNHPCHNIKGQIFDSCPVIPNKRSAEIVGKSFSQLVNIRVLQPIIESLVKFITLIVISMNKDVQGFMSKMEKSPIKSELFLFSKSDQFAPFEDILTFIEERRRMGVNVESKLWESSQHCAHLRNHPEEYEEFVNNFIDKIMKE